MFQSDTIRYGISFIAGFLILTALGLIPNFQEPAPEAPLSNVTRVNIMKAPPQPVKVSQSTVTPPIEPTPIPETLFSIPKPLPQEKQPVPLPEESATSDDIPKEKTLSPSSSAIAPKPAENTAMNDPGCIEYKNLILGSIARRKIYPSSARRREQEGIVKIRITIDKDGLLLSREIIESSGFILLDQATMKAVEKAAPFPRPNTDRTPVEITFGMDYKLK